MTTQIDPDDVMDTLTDNNGSVASLEMQEVAVVQSKAQKMAELLEVHRGERHLMVIHDFPDPDAISAAYAQRLLNAEFEIETDIIYNGKISHP